MSTLVGELVDDRLEYRGVVEWGFRSPDVLELLCEARSPARTSPFVDLKKARSALWLDAGLRAEISYAESGDGSLARIALGPAPLGTYGIKPQDAAAILTFQAIKDLIVEGHPDAPTRDTRVVRRSTGAGSSRPARRTTPAHPATLSAHDADVNRPLDALDRSHDLKLVRANLRADATRDTRDDPR